MRPPENFTPFLTTGLGLTLAILVTFQLYIQREPGRIEADMARDQAQEVAAGKELFASNCRPCHGENGEGLIGPALNSQTLLKTTPDEVLFSLIRTGVPGSTMPAWAQAFGGPFTDQEVNQLVAFIRSWEPTAPLVEAPQVAPDPARGALIFSNTCFVCHGANGEGTERAPAINDPQRLQQFDDTWYRDTITKGRPARGMPTWGTVLSPQQIEDLVALIAAWRQGQVVSAPISLIEHLDSALFALQRADPLDAEFHLNNALVAATGERRERLQEILSLLQQGDLAAAEERLSTLLGREPAGVEQPEGEAPPDGGSVAEGERLFTANCAACHGADGTGGVGPNLHANAHVQSLDDPGLVELILSGVEGTAMPAFRGRLDEGQLRDIVALLRSWQE